MPAGYVDFDLLLTPTAPGYGARVIRSPAGEAYHEFVWPFHAGETGGFFWLSPFALRKLQPIPATSPTQQPTALTPKTFGARLYDAVFGGRIGSVLRRSLDRAEQQELGLRIRLRLHDVPELAAWPWEYLYATDLDRFLALSRDTPLVRYLELDQETPTLSVSSQQERGLRILAVVANPADAEPLAVEREWALLQAALEDLTASGAVVLERLASPTLPALQARLRGAAVHVLHFIGHGYFQADSPETEQGGLIFEDEQGHSRRADAVTLATLCRDHSALRLLFLNACESARGSRDASFGFAGVAQRLVQQGAPAVVAMQFPISDRAAVALAQEFYRALAEVGPQALPVDAALAEARKAVYLLAGENAAQGTGPGMSKAQRAQRAPALHSEWGTPVLYSRATDSVLLAGEAREIASAEEHSAMAAQPSRGPWWERLPRGDATGDTLVGGVETGATQGDVIIANVGAGARNVAVGKGIVQHIYEAVGEPTPDDQEIIREQFAAVQAALSAEGANAQIAAFQLQLLEAELTKTGEEETPSANTIVQVGDWLLNNLPSLAEALTGLFATPAVGRVVGKAGESAVAWVKARFGGRG